MKKLTQKQIIFCLLYENYKNNGAPMAPHNFMGEVYIKALGEHCFVSYEASARLSEINSENPCMLEIAKLTGKSGARYFGYRLQKNTLQDPKLIEVYKRLKAVELKRKFD